MLDGGCMCRHALPAAAAPAGPSLLGRGSVGGRPGETLNPSMLKQLRGNNPPEGELAHVTVPLIQRQSTGLSPYSQGVPRFEPSRHERTPLTGLGEKWEPGWLIGIDLSVCSSGEATDLQSPDSPEPQLVTTRTGFPLIYAYGRQCTFLFPHSHAHAPTFTHALDHTTLPTAPCFVQASTS